MPRQATNSAVSTIEVEVDRPADRAAKRNFLRTNDLDVSISGSGGSQVITTNTSSSTWYLESASVHALGATAGVVQVKVQVRDENSAVVAQGVADGIGGSAIPFPGVNVKPGWDVHVEIAQDDSNPYTVTVVPMFRKPEPGTPGGGGGGTDETTSTDVLEDFERSSPIGDYAGDTGVFATQTSDVFWNDTAVHLNTTNTAGRHQIVSTSGLGDYPADPFTLKARFSSSETTGGTSDEASVGMVFGAADASNFYNLFFDVDDGSLVLLDYSGGSGSPVTNGGFNNWDYPGDTWFRIEADFDGTRNPKLKAKVVDDNGDTRTTLDADIELYGSGVGWHGKLSNGSSEHRYDYMTYEEN